MDNCESYTRISTTRCGEAVNISVFARSPIQDYYVPSTKSATNPSDEAQITKNFKKSIKNLDLTLRGNYEAGDNFVTLTFNDANLPQNADDAKTMLVKALRTIKK